MGLGLGLGLWLGLAGALRDDLALVLLAPLIVREHLSLGRIHRARLLELLG